MKDGNHFVDSALNIDMNFKIPKLIVGAPIVSLLTTLPELLVSG